MEKSTCYIYGFMMLLLSGCAVGPDYHQPASPTPKNYTRKSDELSIRSQKINPNKAISDTWWAELNSSELNNVINLGLKNNYNLDSMQETLAQSNETVKAISGQLWPQVSLTADAGRQKYGVAVFGPIGINIPPYTYYEIGPSASYNPDIFGGTRRAIEKQKALAAYQAQEYNAAYLSLTGNISTTVLNIAMLNGEIQATQAIIAEDKKNLALVKNAFVLGAVTKNDILSAQTQLATDEATLPNLYKELNLAKNALNQLVGKTPEGWTPPNFKLTDFQLPRELPLRIPSDLVRVRPDIVAAEELLHAANAEVGIATANLYPNITLSATLQQEALTPGDLFESSATAWGLLGDITMPIFNGGSLRAERRAAIHAYNAAYANYQEVVLNSFIQVANVLQALQSDAQREALEKTTLDTAQSSLRLSRISFQAGGANILQVLDAERLYALAQRNYVNAQAQRYQDTIQLYLVLGGGKNLVSPLPT